MLCQTCRLDTIPWPKRRYCSRRCRRRAAYLRRRGRPNHARPTAPIERAAHPHAERAA